MYNELVTLISQVGFPIAVSLYLLLERNKAFKELTAAVNNNNIVLTKLCEKLENKQ